FVFFSSRRRHTRCYRDWSSDVCSSDLHLGESRHTAFGLPRVMIVSDDADFSRAVTCRWQTERSVPAFTLMGGDLCHGFDGDAFQLAIVGCIQPTATEAVLKALEPVGKPVLFVSNAAQAAQAVRNTHPRVMVLRQHE